MLEKKFENEKNKINININDIDENQLNNEIHLKNFHPCDCESAPSTPRT